MIMTFYRHSRGCYETRDNRFIVTVNGSNWDIYQKDDNGVAELYAMGFQSLKRAKECVLNTWYSQHVNL